MLNKKKGNGEYDYNTQIITESYTGLILQTNVSQNPTDHHELIPIMKSLEADLEEICGELPSINVLADTGYSSNINTNYLEENSYNGFITSQKLSRKSKKFTPNVNPFSKDNFEYNVEMQTYICPFREPLYKKNEYEYRNKNQNHLLDTKL